MNSTQIFNLCSFCIVRTSRRILKVRSPNNIVKFSTKPTELTNYGSDNATDFNELKEKFREKVIFNTFYKYEDFTIQKKKQHTKTLIKEKMLDRKELVPVSLKYILEEDDNTRELLADNEEVNIRVKDEDNETLDVVLPYEITKVNVSDTAEAEVKVNSVIRNTSSGKWMTDYDCYEESVEDIESSSRYGTPDRTIPASKVPCGGCGALLHCQDPGIPGYLPSEIFTACTVVDLRAITCQRCHFMKNYNTALKMNVDPQHYPKLLERIGNEMALVILLIDLTDFPCSLWPGILDIIGPRRPLFVIGNKVDLLLGDRKGWLYRARESLHAALPKHANIKYSSLISAKTGFGVEELINKLNSLWKYKGHVYLVGCTNVGKSTLFNALLKSDYCNVQASDLLQRATTAPWPGTTMNLLKFPILRPSQYSLFRRTKRLQSDRKNIQAERELNELQNQKCQPEPHQLVGHIGQTYSKHDDDIEQPDMFKAKRKIKAAELPESGLNPYLLTYQFSKWFYDTPGVVQPDQIINLLTTDELMQTLPKTQILHRVFIFRQNWTLFIAGLARLDFIALKNSSSNVENRTDFIKIVIFCPNTLPVTMCKTDVADSLYDEFVGTKMFAVPSGGPERLKLWPPLKSAEDIVLQGISFNQCCADIVLSNAGWISVAPNEGQICKFRGWTPDARGIHVRRVPLIGHAVTVHGPRMRGTPAYSRRYLKETNIKASP